MAWGGPVTYVQHDDRHREVSYRDTLHCAHLLQDLCMVIRSSGRYVCEHCVCVCVCVCAVSYTHLTLPTSDGV